MFKITVAETGYLVYSSQTTTSQPDPSELMKVCEKHGLDGFIEASRSTNTQAEWKLTPFLHSGPYAKLSGTAVLAASEFLVKTELVHIRDRRQTLPLYAGDTVIDTLRGVSGISADLGRWQLLKEDSTSKTIFLQLGKTHGVKVLTETDEFSDEFYATRIFEEYPNAEQACIVSPEPVSARHEGIGAASARFFLRDGLKRVSSGTGAIASAVGARHFLAANPPHHWRVSTEGGTIAVRMFPTEDGEHVSLNAEVSSEKFEVSL